MTMTTGNKPEEAKLPDAWAGIEAKPLRTLDVLEHVRPRNPAMELYWGNYGIGGGLRWNQLLFAGFVAAKPEELGIKPAMKPIPKEMIKEGRVIYGDLCAMLISKPLYQGALKHNALTAIDRGNRLRQREDIQAVKQSIVGRAPNEIAKKLTVFTPSESEVDRLSEANEKEGKNLG